MQLDDFEGAGVLASKPEGKLDSELQLDASVSWNGSRTVIALSMAHRRKLRAQQAPETACRISPVRSSKITRLMWRA